MARSRSKNIWHLFNRKESPFWWVWRYDENNPGKRIRKPTTKRKSDYTRDQMIKIINLVQGVIIAEKTNDYSIAWFEDYTARKLMLEGISESTRSEYKVALSVLKEIYGQEYSILNIKRDAIDNVKILLIEKGRAANTINGYLKVIRAAFERLVIDEKIDKNPFYKIKPIPVKIETKRHFTLTELIDFLEFVKKNSSEDIYRLTRIYAGTGRRRNEILFLERNDVDIEKGIYRPRDIKSRDKHKLSRRIPDDVLTDFQYFMDKYQDVQFPFKIFCADFISKTIKKLINQAGYPTLTLHSFRHSYITILKNYGHDLREIQRIIGHTHITTTETYTHDEILNIPSIGISIK